ncbi:hypothetical protein scyTo_0015944, partial [Scyliorhinus torazame]|nr:hypothetical protein [Scyliorhinus torazame]
GITAISCQIGIVNALEDQKAADCRVRSQEANISKCKSDLKACRHNIKMKMAEITQIEKKIQSLDDELTNRHESLKKSFETDCKLKEGMTVLNELYGKVEVIKNRSEKFVHLDALITVVGDTILHISHLPLREAGKVLCLEMGEVNKLKLLTRSMKANDCSVDDFSEFW